MLSYNINWLTDYHQSKKFAVHDFKFICQLKSSDDCSFTIRILFIGSHYTLSLIVAWMKLLLLLAEENKQKSSSLSQKQSNLILPMSFRLQAAAFVSVVIFNFILDLNLNLNELCLFSLFPFCSYCCCCCQLQSNFDNFAYFMFY